MLETRSGDLTQCYKRRRPQYPALSQRCLMLRWWRFTQPTELTHPYPSTLVSFDGGGFGGGDLMRQTRTHLLSILNHRQHFYWISSAAHVLCRICPRRMSKKIRFDGKLNNDRKHRLAINRVICDAFHIIENLRGPVSKYPKYTYRQTLIFIGHCDSTECVGDHRFMIVQHFAILMQIILYYVE